MAIFEEEKNGQGRDTEVANDKIETKQNKSQADTLLNVIRGLNATRRVALVLNDRLLLHLLDMATLQVTESLTDRIGLNKRPRKLKQSNKG